jgi:hypothetical protein
MAILFWGAKRRQWAVAETIRRSVKRVGTGLKNLTPRTPHKMTFSPIEKRRAGGAGDELLLQQQKSRNKISRSGGMRDVEKFAAAAVASSTRQGSNESFVKQQEVPLGGPNTWAGGNVAKKERPVPPRVQVPGNQKQVVESPTPKTPMWNNVFGR